MAQRAGVFDGWTFDRTINLPMLFTVAGAAVAMVYGAAKMDARMARGEERTDRIERTLEKMADTDNELGQLRVRVTTNEASIRVLQDDVKAMR